MPMLGVMAGPRSKAAVRGTVLVVEDDADVRSSVCDQLRDDGFEVHAAEDGEQAWKLLVRGQKPDLIVLDLKLPVMSGWELLTRLRASVTLLDVPVVVVSAYLGFPPAGALAWLKKPMRSAELTAVVERLIRH